MSRRNRSLLVVISLVFGLLGFVLSVAGSVGAVAWPEVAVQPAAPSLTSTPYLTVALSAEPDSLDPAQTFDANAFLVGTQIYETLITFAPNDLSPRPGLADAWSVSADGTVWIFNIPPGENSTMAQRWMPSPSPRISIGGGTPPILIIPACLIIFPISLAVSKVIPVVC